MRVRVEAFSNTSATDLPVRGRGASGVPRPSRKLVRRVQQAEQAVTAQIGQLEEMPCHAAF